MRQSNLLQKRLAQEVTCMVHSQEAYEMAVEASAVLFGNATSETLKKIDTATLLAIFEGVPQFEIDTNDLSGEVKLMDLLTTQAPVFASKGEMRKMIQNGGLFINKEKITDTEAIATSNLLLNNTFILVQKGKKNYYLLRVK